MAGGLSVDTIGSANRPKQTAGILVFLMLAVPGAVSAPGEGDSGARLKNAGTTGERLPGWIKDGVRELVKEIPTLPRLPRGYTLSIGDIVLADSHRGLQPLISPAQCEFLMSRRVPSFVIEHRFPIYVIRESPDVAFIESLCAKGLYRAAVLQAKAILAHEALHVWYDPTQGLSGSEIARLTAEQLERRQEIAGYELQLLILRRDLATGKYWAMQKLLAPARVDLTAAIEEGLAALKSGAPVSQFVFLESPPSSPPD
ncbi:MAG: hypothetical protein JST11_07340 [Acidobacteria bacterium]|nr:hypothetical protein [Acidobacteriota bacterium]